MTTGPLRPDDTVIDRLKVRGVAGDTAELQAQLARASWPYPADGSWVFIREVQVKATPDRLVGGLLSQTRSLVSGAGDGDGSSNVVRFKSFTELLGRLITDLITGSAGRRWYWQRWAHLFDLPAGRAVARLMTEHVEYLPAVTSRLARLSSLSGVWLALDPAEARQLVEVIARQSGFRVPDLTEQSGLPERGDPVDALPSALYHRWVGTLARLRATDPRRLLALIVIGREVFPWPLQKSAPQVLATLDQIFPSAAPLSVSQLPAGDRPPNREHRPAASHRRSEESADRPKPTDSFARAEQEVTPSTGNISPSPPIPPTPLGERRDPTPDPIAPTGPADTGIDDATAPLLTPTKTDPRPERETVGSDARKEQPPAERPGLHLVEGEQSSLVGDSFHTHQAGLCYLLNFLNRPEVQTLIDESDAWRTMPSGWGWLYRLGRELELDTADPIALFLAQQLNLETVDQLEQLPELPLRDPLLKLAGHWYGRRGLWNTELLQLPAKIRFTASHLDVYASLDHVRLPIRLAGLDINPGWLPWLGRVVTFHYE